VVFDVLMKCLPHYREQLESAKDAPQPKNPPRRR
jgi:hypothetical protein